MRGLAQHPRDGALLAAGDARRLALPGPEAFAASLRGTLLAPDAPPLLASQWTWARYKPGHSLCLGFELDLGVHGRVWAGSKQYLDGRDAGLASAPDPASVPAWPLRRLQAQRDDGTFLFAFPGDRVLCGLPRAFDLRRRARELHAQPALAELRWSASRSHAEVLRYKPERRCVLRVDWRVASPGGRGARLALGLRVLAPEAAERCLGARNRLDFPWTPRLCGANARRGLIHEEWLEREEASSAPVSAAEAGALLAELHARALSQDVPRVPPSADREEVLALLAIEPRLRERAERVLGRDPVGELAWSHGDFHLDQLLRSRRGLVLLDLDSLGAAPREVDLASWIADEIAARPSSAPEEALEGPCSGYAYAGGRPPGRPALRAAVANELVRRAAAGLRRLEQDALPRADVLLDAAERVLRGAPARALPPLARARRALEAQFGRAASASIERCEVDENGEPTLTLQLPGGRRWLRSAGGTLHELALGDDPRLPGAARAAREIAAGRAELVSWRPGRRFVLRREHSFRKGTRARRFDGTLERQLAVQAAARGRAVRVAAVLEIDRDQASFDLERLPGEPFDFGRDAARAGELAVLLVEWRALELPALPQHTRADELALLDSLANRHARACGVLPSGWTALRERLDGAGAGSATLVTCHRDLFEAQILVTDGSLALLDFDLACRAEPVLDPANLLAHLDLARLRGAVGDAQAAEFEARLCAALDAHGICDGGGLRFFRCASLLRLALVWGVRAHGEKLAVGLLARAAEIEHG